MIADSSSRLQRAGTGNSMATALRDRGPCVIPVQPNRSLPIRPAPPMPTRSASIVTSQKTRSPMLRLSKSVNVNVIEMQSNASPISSLSNDLNKFSFSQQDGKSDKMMRASEFIDHSDYNQDMTQITKETGSAKRKKDDEDRNERDIGKETKKRKKSYETEAMRDERSKSISKDYSKTCSTNWPDKGKKKPQQHVMVRLWDNKNYSSTIVVSTTESEVKKTNEICKIVPPLRLKKVMREANTTDDHSKVKVNTESENESNYRIVTGATPRPESPSEYSANTFWSNVNLTSKKPDPSVNNIRDKSWRSSAKSDGYKIKYRRNRLRQKLRELRAKALDLSREMAADTNPQQSTRLRQMMNCYEKQIENISKLLCKLSASISPNDNIVDLDYEKPDKLTPIENTADDEVEQVNGISTSSVSPSPSPEPPKLSPRSPIDSEKSKSPDTLRDSPPILPRVYIAIQSSTVECLKQNTDTVKSWHKSDNSSVSQEKEEIKLNDTNQTIHNSTVTVAPAISSVSSSEFESPGSNTDWDGEVDRLELKNSKIEENISEDVKTFHDKQERQCEASPSISDNFLDSTMVIEMTKTDVTNTTEESVVKENSDKILQNAEAFTSKQVTCKKLELKHIEESSETLSSSLSIVEGTRKVYDTEYESYDSEERIGNENTAVANRNTAVQEATTTVRQLQAPAANVTNILQLQSNYYGSPVAQDNIVFTDVAQNSKDGRKVTSSMNQPATLDPTVPIRFTPSGSAVSNSNQQCIVLPNSCSSKVVQENSSQQNDGSRIMTEQFPTLGNWVARMSREKKQTTKSKSKLQSGVTLPTTSIAETVSGLETQKNRENAPNNATRNNIVNVAPQWNTERWQRQQHQQCQQQLYAATSSAAPSVRPGICPPISVTQFYPPNYAIDPYGSAAFGYHSAMCSYDNYSYHSRLHGAAPSLSGYQIGPLQDSHTSLRQMSHIDKRFPANLLDTRTRHFAKDLLKYPGALSTSNYQHAANSLDYDRLRTTTAAATQNGSAPPACLPPLLLPPPPPLIAPAQQTLARTSLAGYPTSGSQCSRNRIIPDVVAAAAAAAVVAAASFGRQQGSLPPYGRTDTGIVSGDIGGVINKESLLMANRTNVNRERLSQEHVQSVNGVNVESRLNNNGYHQLQNLILDTLPYVKTDNYSQPPAIFADNAQETVSSASTSTYKSTPILAPGNSLATKESTRKESRNCETPHLGKVSRTLETTNNLECSNCGLAGSMFKCLGCEAAFYCDERCQTRHWNIHVEKCPKRMPKLKKLI
ncbi:uncharacterized protein LOC109853893 isoform X2 [Pseudomyrmex gracilis]|nr:uncharacterized protein LOC109853893 isoform X2 [Pseudomyrmex gracilis]